MSDPELLWTPSPEQAEAATITRYQAWLESERGLTFGSYEELWQWSVDDIEGFWSSICEFFSVRFDRPPTALLGRREMPGTEWFPGGRLSYAEHIFRGKRDEDVALFHASETRPVSSWTWAELRRQTAAIAAGLRARGIGEGDRVVAYMPNIPETLAAFLACASIGATWSSAAPEFGARSVIDRFAQIEPKLLLAIDGYRYGGRDFDRGEIVAEIAAEIPTLEGVVRLGYLDDSGWEPGFLVPDTELGFAQLPFEHPLWVLYSSGTTGLPKAIVHGQGGMLLEHLKKMNLHLDAQPHDRVFWFTTTGWMMWNFLIGVLFTDASIVLFDGNPGHPDMGALWDLAEQTGTTCFGTSAAFIAGCMKAEIEPKQGRPLSACARSARPGHRSHPRGSAGSTTSSAPTRGCSRPPAAAMCVPRSWAACRRCPCISASSRPVRWALAWKRGTPTARRSWVRSASW